MIGAQGQSNWPALQGDFLNLTGATLTQAQVAQIDLLQANAASTSVDLGLDNMVAVTTNGINAGGPFAVVTDDSIAQNVRGKVARRGPVLCSVNAAVAVAIGDPLVPVNGQTYMVKQTGTGPVVAYARALQALASGTANILVFLEGNPAIQVNQGSV